MAVVVPLALLLPERSDRRGAERALADERRATREQANETQARTALGSVVIYTELDEDDPEDRNISGWRVTAKVTNLGTSPAFAAYLFVELDEQADLIGIWLRLPPGADYRGTEILIRDDRMTSLSQPRD